MLSIGHNLYSLGTLRSEKHFSAACFGLDNAGKTTLINTLKGEISDLEAGNPTFGRAPHSVKYEESTIKFVDIGGGKNMRNYWKDVYAEIHAVVYVVDSACPERFEESRQFLFQMVEDSLLDGKPLLILLNKRDCQDAVAEGEMAVAMRFDELSAKKWQMQGCVALRTSDSVPVDSGVTSGFRWLADAVAAEYEALDDRVERDIVLQKEREKEEAAKRREERVRRREEREAREAAEAQEEAMKASEQEQVAVPMMAQPPQEEGQVVAVAGTDNPEPPSTPDIRAEQQNSLTPGDPCIKGGGLAPLKVPSRLEPLAPRVMTPEKPVVSKILQDSPTKESQTITNHPNMPPSPSV